MNCDSTVFELNYDYSNNKYGSKSRLVFTDSDTSCLRSKLKMFMKILVRIKK